MKNVELFSLKVFTYNLHIDGYQKNPTCRTAEVETWKWFSFEKFHFHFRLFVAKYLVNLNDRLHEKIKFMRVVIPNTRPIKFDCLRSIDITKKILIFRILLTGIFILSSNKIYWNITKLFSRKSHSISVHLKMRTIP